MANEDWELTDSLSLGDVTSGYTGGGRTPLSRQHPHRGKYCLAVHVPAMPFDAEVATVTPDVGGTTVTFTNHTGTYTDCLSGMTVKVYTAGGDYKGKVRMRSLSNPANSATLEVAEQDHLNWTVGDTFEIYDVMELWSVFPRVVEATIQNLDVDAATDEGGGTTGLPLTGHGYSTDDEISVSGTTNYDGIFVVLAASTANVIHITAEYVAENFDGSETVQGTEHTSYKDWDIAWHTADSGNIERLIFPIIGPPTCAFLDGGSASIYFDATKTYVVPGRAKYDYTSDFIDQWYFQSGTPNQSGDATAGLVVWGAAGVYRVRYHVYENVSFPPDYPAASNAYRYVHIFERTGANAPYSDFNVSGLFGGVSDGGWQADFEVFTDADEDAFPEGAQVILFAEEELGDYNFGDNEPASYRSEVKYVGYIVEGSVTVDSEASIVRFSTVGIHRIMQNRDNYSVALDHASAPSKWEELDDLDANKALAHVIHWHSTLSRIADVFLPSFYYYNWKDISHRTASYLVKYQDFSRATLYAQLNDLAQDIMAQVLVDRWGRVSIANDPQFTDPDNLEPDLPDPVVLTSADWIDELVITFADEPKVSIACVEGMAFDGATVTPLIAYYPGELPTYRGSALTRSGVVLSDQSGANFLATCLFAIANNKYPSVEMQCSGNYSFLDITMFGGIEMSLSAGATRRGIVWSDKRLFIVEVENEIDVRNGTLLTRVKLVCFAADDPRILFA